MKSMEVSSITPILGAEIWPLSLESIDPEETWALLAKYGVLALRGIKELSRESFASFGARLGSLEISPKPVPGFPELTNFTHDKEHPPTENIWHSDMSFLDSPPLARILRPTALPEVGGDTVFADMHWVLQSLPPNLAEAIEGLEAEHDIAKQAPPELSDELRAKCPPLCHPLIKVHPISGRRYLFCNPAYTTKVQRVTAEQSDTLLNLFFSRTQLPEAQCRIRWDLETVLLWDNRHLQHYAVADYLPAVRSMERISVVSQ